MTVKGAEDVLNKQFAFELSTNRDTMYFIADTDKVGLPVYDRIFILFEVVTVVWRTRHKSLL